MRKVSLFFESYKDFIVVILLNKFWRINRLKFLYDGNINGSILMALFVLYFPILRRNYSCKLGCYCDASTLSLMVLCKRISTCICNWIRIYTWQWTWYAFPLGNEWSNWIEISNALQKRDLWILQKYYIVMLVYSA